MKNDHCFNLTNQRKKIHSHWKNLNQSILKFDRHEKNFEISISKKKFFCEKRILFHRIDKL